MSYVKVCPKCNRPNNEEADLCDNDGEFLGAVPPSWQADSVTPLPSPTKCMVPPPATVSNSAAAEHVTTRWEPMPTLLLEWLEQGLLLTLRDGQTLGQEHASRPADIRLPATLPGVGKVHRWHVRFVWENGVWQVFAINQGLHGGNFTNPTFVNGALVSPGTKCALRHGDTLTLSGVVLRVRISS